MPNRETHIPVGIATPYLVLFIYLLRQNPIPSIFFDYSWLALIAMGVFGFLGERIPDFLNPPDNPQHRGIIHLLGILPTLYVIVFLVFTAPMLPIISSSYDNVWSLFFVSFCSGYASHFLLDYVIS